MIDRRKLALGITLAAVALGSWWATRSVAPPAPTADARTRHEPDYIIENFDATTMNEHGARRYDLKAKRLVHYPDDDTSHLTEPQLVQYPLEGTPVVTRADTGVMPGDGREILMRGNVHVTRTADKRSPGGEMTADDLRVELDRQR